MTVYALQPRQFCEGLQIEALLDDVLFEKAIDDLADGYGPDAYWDGNLQYQRVEEIKRVRRRLEDRIRKDNKALLRAWGAVFNK